MRKFFTITNHIGNTLEGILIRVILSGIYGNMWTSSKVLEF